MSYEYLGITGTLLILVGFLTDGERKIRLFNIAGSVLFVTYGILIGSFSTIILNGSLIIVHIIKLWRKKGLPDAR